MIPLTRMRLALLLLPAIAGWSTYARDSEKAPHRFNAAEWFAHRDGMTEDAQRLREEYAKTAARATAPAQDVTVPIDNYRDGSVKSSINAQRAQFFIDTGLVWGEGVTIRQYSQSGEVEAEVRAENCVVDRKSRCGWTEGNAIVTYRGTTVEGAQVYFSLTDEYIAILGGSRIISTDLKFGDIKL